MRWAKARPANKWHWWFAWHPVDTGNETVWLEWVERRTVCKKVELSPEVRQARINAGLPAPYPFKKEYR